MRLIDADALKADYGMKDDCEDCEKELKGYVKQCQYDAVYTKMDFCGWIDAMPTIEPESKYLISIQDAIDAFKEFRGRMAKDKAYEYVCKLKKLPSAQSERSVIEDEVWGFVKKLEQEIPVRDLMDIYGDESEIYQNFTYQEAKAKYDEFKQKDEIHVGDEVEHTTANEIPSAEPETSSSGSISCMKSENTHVKTTDGLISRQAAIDAVSGGMCSGWDCDVIDKLKAVSSTESESETGTWIWKHCVWWCSECGKNPTKGTGYVQGTEELFDYCPHCGKKMEGVQM